MALEIRHLKNCLDQYFKTGSRPLKHLQLGYMEACLVQFDVIESKENGVADYAITKSDGQPEGRSDIIIRLAQEFLRKKKV